MIILYVIHTYLFCWNHIMRTCREIQPQPSRGFTLAKFSWSTTCGRGNESTEVVAMRRLDGFLWILTGWWFGTFFIFPYIGNNTPNWHILGNHQPGIYPQASESRASNFGQWAWFKSFDTTTFKYVEGGPDHKAPEVVWNTSSIRIFKCMFKYINWIPYV